MYSDPIPLLGQDWYSVPIPILCPVTVQRSVPIRSTIQIAPGSILRDTEFYMTKSTILEDEDSKNKAKGFYKLPSEVIINALACFHCSLVNCLRC